MAGKVLFVLRVLRGEEGITTNLAVLAEALQAQGWEVGIAASTEAGQEEQARGPAWFEARGVRFFPIPFPRRVVSPRSLPRALKALAALDDVVRRFQPDVLHTQSLSVSPFTYLVRLRRRTPVVATCQLEPEPGLLKVRVGTAATRLLPAFLGDRAIAISSDLQRTFRDTLHVPEERIRVIHNSVDDGYFRPPEEAERKEARRAYGLAPEDRVVCLIGRLEPVKGHDVLVRALARLRAGGLAVHALCAGTGTAEAALRQQARAAGVADLVHLLGFTDTRQVLWASDALVLPSRREGFPLVVGEAMFCGVVPIRTPAAGAADQIEDGVSGFIVPFDDDEALAGRIGEVLREDALRARLAAAARARARARFSRDRIAEQTIAVYREVMRRAPAP